jgi:hypothetical protein
MGMEVVSLEPFGLSGPEADAAQDQVAGPAANRLREAVRIESPPGGSLVQDGAHRASALEDEVRFGSVRQLVEYEDYILLKLKEAGSRHPSPVGSSS